MRNQNKVYPKKGGVYYIFPTPAQNNKKINMLDNNIYFFMNTWIKTYINTQTHKRKHLKDT